MIDFTTLFQHATFITNNSRDVVKNTVFLAFPGLHVDARTYIPQAIAAGACVILYENKDGFSYEDNQVPCIGITDLKTAQAGIAAAFYHHPTKKLRMIGVTGTNGKTSVTQFIAQVLAPTCGVIGTLGYGMPGQLKKLSNTTPDGVVLQTIFHDFVHAGIQTVAMEVSSHSLVERRVDEIPFETAVFTNLTQDHLDFHGTMENYRDAKAMLFQTPGLKNAVINIDDETGRLFAAQFSKQLRVVTYSRHDKNASIYVEEKNCTAQGFALTVRLPTQKITFQLPLIGDFNIENMLAVMGVLYLVAPEKITPEILSTIQPVTGRMQVIAKANCPTVVIDYAHTPDALEKALQSVRNHVRGKVWCIFGCGGNRDKTKRPKMGAIAARYADESIITNDNPRDEDPMEIAQAIREGMPAEASVEIILDRASAIETAFLKASAEDWILLAGKGHEVEQIIGNQVLYHSDIACYQALLEKKFYDEK